MSFETFDHIFDATIGLDLKGNIIYFNNQALIFFKLSLRQFRQRSTVEELFVSTDTDIHKWISDALISFGLKVSEETHIKFLHDDTESTVVIKMIPVEAEEGNRFALVFQDKTLEHTLHSKYREQVENLKQAHNQIVQADKLATLGQLTASISHEINNPLTIATGHAEILTDLLDGPNPLEQLDLLKMTAKNISESLDRMNKIVINMQSFLSNQEDPKSYCNVTDIINNAARWVKAQYDGHDINVKINCANNPILLANPLKAEQAVLNIVKNACEALIFSNTPNPTINIQTTFKQNHIVISIADNGPGIPEEIKPNLFKPFSTDKKAGKGTGLGLSICSKIMASHKGTAKLLDSKIGAHFILAFPCSENYSYLLSGNRPNKVLVIDSNVDFLNETNSILNARNISMIGSNNIEQSLSLLEKARINSVILNPKVSESAAVQLQKTQLPIYELDDSAKKASLNSLLSKIAGE